MRRLLVLTVLLAVGRHAAGDPPAPTPKPGEPAPSAQPAAPPERPVYRPLTPEQAADAALAAVMAKDDAALKALAANDDPDPWLVADELLARTAADVAAAFARAAPRKDVERLPGYVAGRRGKPDDASARTALAAANAALASGKPKDALGALGLPDPATTDVVGIRRLFGRGLAFAADGRAEESTTAFLVAADAAERAGWLARSSRALLEAGNGAYLRFDYHGAISAWERRRTLSELREDRAAAALTLGSIGSAHSSLGDYPKALEAFAQAHKELEALGDRLGAARTLGSIANAHQALGNHAKALEILELALKAQVALGDRVGAAYTLEGIGNVHYWLGNYTKALEIDEQALHEQEALGDRAGAPQTLRNIGNVHWSLGNYAKALEFLERALKEQRALGDRVGVAETLGCIGNVHCSLGNYAKALETQEWILKESEALGDRVLRVTALQNIGNVHSSLGNYAKALEVYERGLSELESLGDLTGVTHTLVNLGIVYSSLGNHLRALEEYERAFKQMQARGEQAGAALTLGLIGSEYSSLGNHAKALEFYERALGEEETLGDRMRAASTLGSIGIVHYALGDYAKALEFYGRALREHELIGDRAGAASMLGCMGNAHFALGNLAKALEFLERALQEKLALGNNAGAAFTHRDISLVREALGEPGKALAAARQGVLLLPTLVSGLGEEQGATAREQYAGLFDVGIRASAATHDVAQAGFFLEQGRAGSLLESFSAREALRSGVLPQALVSAEAEARAREAAAVKAYRKSLDAGDLQAIRTLRADMESSQDAVRAVIDDIQREAKRAASVLYPTAASLEMIRNTLKPEEALVLYALTDTQALALVLTAKEARIVPLSSSTKDIDAACEAFDPTDRSADSGSAAGALGKMVIEPLRLSGDVRRVLVSTDGALSYVPFALLLDNREVAYLPSGTTYGLLREEKDLRGEGILALGDPDYVTRVDERALAVVRGGTRLAPLPGTREEAKAVGTVTLLGSEASEAGLRDAVAKRPRWRAVHFACHGLIDAERPAFSSLALTPDGEDDGFLTSIEVFRMRIPADLVVLSACETGKGKIVKGEGIVGLTRAFMFAGAPRVICSLWKVDDDATKALMLKFYDLWNPKDGSKAMGTAAALRAAQEYVRSREKWKHPYYWAAWVLWGLPD